jgi:hypothetical protein
VNNCHSQQHYGNFDFYQLNAVHTEHKQNSQDEGKADWVLNCEEVEVRPHTILTTGL